MNWVLDHVLTNSDPYQTTLPLRTIYTLNCQTGKTSPADFKTLLMEHLQNMPVQPCTLPPVFLTTFIKKCFPADFDHVDFDQALTALDYLRDLEHRRTKELEKAIRARGQHDQKITVLRGRSVKLDRLYAIALTGIRRFTLINELSLPRFNKCNCVALLNTLYPIEEQDINNVLNSATLSQQRQALWKYIISVEKNGPNRLDPVRNQGDWRRISDIVYEYCQRSLALIQAAEDLSRPASYGSFRSDSTVAMEPASPKQSFGRRDSGNDSSEGESEGSGKKSTLEKIVRGLAKLGTSSSKKVYSSDWNVSVKNVYHSGRSPRRMFSSEWNGSIDDVKMRYD
jgi:hypothetical protein